MTARVRSSVEVTDESPLGWATRCIVLDCPHVVSSPRSLSKDGNPPPRICAAHPVADIPSLFAEFKEQT